MQGVWVIVPLVASRCCIYWIDCNLAIFGGGCQALVELLGQWACYNIMYGPAKGRSAERASQ